MIRAQIKILADIPVTLAPLIPTLKKNKAVLEDEKDYFTSSSEDSNIECETSDDEYTTYDTKTRHSERWSQKELNDLIQDLRLPKNGAEHLASALNEEGNLAKGTESSVHRNGEQNFRK